MNEAESRYRAALVEGARALGIALDDRAADRITAHYALVVKWAAKINLTSVLEPVEAAHLHGLDSLLFVADIPIGARVTDVGSGAGFPGIVVALARPDLSMVLLEPRRKRASFLRVACAELALEARVIEGKLAPPGIPSVSGAFPAQVILSRATIPPLELLPRAAAVLEPSGRIILTQGANALDLAAAGESAGLVHVSRRSFQLPGGVTRVLDVFAR